MIPSLFAIFVVCSADLLVCNNISDLVIVFRSGNVEECNKFVEDVLSLEYEDDNIRMGKCVWRIVE